jgi:hypothetical protein
MTRVVQEKFQVRMPTDKGNADQGNGWVSDTSARVKKGLPTDKALGLNSLPPGSDIGDQELSDQRHHDYSMAGETDISRDTNPESLMKGFTRKKMLTTDDEYTNEHTDIFYGEVNVEGDVGFVERGNMLDRL